MKCCDCCGGGMILPHDAMNDRLYWVKERNGEQCAAWRGVPNDKYQWVIPDVGHKSSRLVSDVDLVIIHEIIPED